ncbi:hypothetical protein GCM10027299_03270 [Larkinella ripae]
MNTEQKYSSSASIATDAGQPNSACGQSRGALQTVDELFDRQGPIVALKTVLSYHIQYECPRHQQPPLAITCPNDVIRLFRPIYEGSYPIPGGNYECQLFLLLMCQGKLLGIKFVGWSYNDIADSPVVEAYRWNQYLGADAMIVISAHADNDHTPIDDSVDSASWDMPKEFERYAAPDLYLKLIDHIRISPTGEFSYIAANNPYYTGGTWPPVDEKEQRQILRPEDQYDDNRPYDFNRILPDTFYE